MLKGQLGPKRTVQGPGIRDLWTPPTLCSSTYEVTCVACAQTWGRLESHHENNVPCQISMALGFLGGVGRADVDLGLSEMTPNSCRPTALGSEPVRDWAADATPSVPV